MDRGRSFRRHCSRKAKERVRFIGRHAWGKFSNTVNGDEDPRIIGIDASTHCCSCSCWVCGNPRRHTNCKKDMLTNSEKRADVSMYEQLLECSTK